MKSFRQEKILDVIRSQNIGTQEELIAALAEAGVHSTQATISRDMKELRLVKQVGANGKVYYAATATDEVVAMNEKLEKILRECVIQADNAQNMVVIKTLPGLASAAAAAIDNMDMSSIVGTLAGDDTAFIVMRDNASAARFCEQILQQLH